MRDLNTQLLGVNGSATIAESRMPPALKYRADIFHMKSGLQKAIEIMGGYTAMARALGVDRNGIRRWHAVPAKWIIKIEHLTGVPREELRPDLYLAPRPKPSSKR